MLRRFGSIFEPNHDVFKVFMGDFRYLGTSELYTCGSMETMGTQSLLLYIIDTSI